MQRSLIYSLFAERYYLIVFHFIQASKFANVLGPKFPYVYSASFI